MKWLDRLTSKTTAMVLAFVMVMSASLTGIMLGFHEVRANTPEGPTPHTARYKMVSAGNMYTLGIRQDGSLWAWGRNDQGQLGIGSWTRQTSPVQVGTHTDWEHVSAGTNHSLGIRRDGSLWAWGRNDEGQFGTGTPPWSSATPLQVGIDTDWTNATAGQSHSLGIRQDGSLWGWGRNNSGQLGLGGSGAQQSTPVQIGTYTDWTHISAGANHSMGIRYDGSLWAWGSNNNGEVHDTSNTIMPSPIQQGVPSTHTLVWVDVSAGAGFSSGIRESSALAWGANTNRQVSSLSQARVTNMTSQGGGTQISAGGAHTVIIRANGELFARGFNGNGQLGIGSTTTQSSMTRVGTFTDWTYISAGGSHTLGLRQDGSLWAFGRNDEGQLGIGTTEDQLTPIGPTPDQLDPPPCTHSFPSTWTPVTPASCTSDGLESRTCTLTGCDHTETRAIPSPGHNYQWIQTTPPTCTSNAILSYRCTVCNATNGTDTGASPHGHNWTAWQVLVPATCLQDGYDIRECSRLGCTHTDTRETSKDPCGICEDCDPQCSHNFIDLETILPTCTVSGSISRECTKCEHPDYEILDPISHTLAWIQTTPPTCTTAGIESNKCACGHVTEVRTGTSPTGHDWAEWETTTPPTCTSLGIEEMQCENCPAKETNILPENPRPPEDPCEVPACVGCKQLIDNNPNPNPNQNPNTGLDLTIPIIVTSLVALIALTLQIIVFGIRRKRQRNHKPTSA